MRPTNRVNADAIAKLVEWFFENYDSEIVAINNVNDLYENRSGTVRYNQPIVGTFGIFTPIVKTAWLDVQFREVGGDYRGMPLNLLRISVGLRYELKAGGTSGNEIAQILCDADGKFGPQVLEYTFTGQEPVVLDRRFTLPRFDAIVKAPTTTEVPDTAPLRYAMMNHLIHEVTDDTMGQVLQFVGRFHPEYQVIFMKGVLQLRPNTAMLPAFHAKLDEMSKMIL